MTVNEVLKLIDAGYTAEEIRAMDKPEDKPEIKPEDKPEDKPEGKPEDKPEIKPESKSEDVEVLKTKIGEMEKTIKDLQESNLKKNFVETPDDPVNKNIEDFLKSL